MTRSVSDNPALAPNTRVRVSNGLCSACYRRRKRTPSSARVQAVKHELDAFLAARQRRAAVAARRNRFAVAS